MGEPHADIRTNVTQFDGVGVDKQRVEVPCQEIRREAHRQEPDRSAPRAMHFFVETGGLNRVRREITAVADTTIVGRGQLAIRGMNDHVIEAGRLRSRRFPKTVVDPMQLYERKASLRSQRSRKRSFGSNERNLRPMLMVDCRINGGSLNMHAYAPFSKGPNDYNGNLC